MGVVRNCIDIVGITSENELPSQINGQLIEASETENLFIDKNIEIKNIYQIIIETSIKGTRTINTPISKIIVIDGHKKFKIAYYDKCDNMGILELESPYNLFFDIENSKTQIEKMDMYIADAYFELINKNIVYCNILYMLDVQYFNNIKKVEEKNKYKPEINAVNFYAAYDSSDSHKRKNDEIFKEVSISKSSKKEAEIKAKIDINEENKLIDIEAEYL